MAYTRINWQDLPSTATPRNATNLNKMDSAIKEHDDKLLGNTPMGNVVVDSIRTKNMFDKDAIITPGYLDNSGNLVTTDATLSCGSVFIPVKPSTTYTISSSSSTVYRIAYYNSSKTFISRIFNDNASLSYTFTTPSNASYIKMAGTLTSVLGSLQIEEGSATSYSPYQDLNNDVSTGQVNLNISTTAVEINSYARSGKVASLKLTITIQNQVSANATTQIGTNLPKPNRIFGNNGWEFFGVSKSDKSNIRCRIDEGGVLTFWYLNNQIPAGTQLYFFTTYITD